MEPDLSECLLNDLLLILKVFVLRVDDLVPGHCAAAIVLRSFPLDPGSPRNVCDGSSLDSLAWTRTPWDREESPNTLMCDEIRVLSLTDDIHCSHFRIVLLVGLQVLQIVKLIFDVFNGLETLEPNVRGPVEVVANNLTTAVMWRNPAHLDRSRGLVLIRNGQKWSSALVGDRRDCSENVRDFAERRLAHIVDDRELKLIHRTWLQVVHHELPSSYPRIRGGVEILILASRSLSYLTVLICNVLAILPLGDLWSGHLWSGLPIWAHDLKPAELDGSAIGLRQRQPHGGAERIASAFRDINRIRLQRHRWERPEEH
mmetsp:Transcript_61882/g.111284  ORF Transcript_61882/g.111284 Transcript_61882/m.111284 type:complete len:315 (+) Transcript_61882:832-1776(+)